LTRRENEHSNEDTLSGTVSLDASVLIELLSGTALSKTVTAAIENDQINPYTTHVALTEAEYILCRRDGWDKAKEKIEKLIQSRVVETVDDEQIVHEASRTKCARSIALGDCFTIALAEKVGGTAVFAHLEEDLRKEMKRKAFSQRILFLENLGAPQSMFGIDKHPRTRLADKEHEAITKDTH
jgi:predicted nucleic acid-binding protein